MKVSFPKIRPYSMLYRAEWKENFKHKVINPPHKYLTINSRHGYKMAARFFPINDNSHNYAILLHGHNNSSMTCGKYALMFNEKGINCLAPDLRRSGETGGRGITFGYFEREDVEQWIDVIYQMDPNAKIGLFGISLGAATAVLVASMRNDIEYLISYCSYSSYKEIVFDRGEEMYPGLLKILYPALVLSTYMITKARVDTIDIVRAMKKVSCPTLILHSEDDDFTSYSHALRLLEANKDAELKSFKGAPHARAYSLQPKLYRSYIYNFLDKII